MATLLIVVAIVGVAVAAAAMVNRRRPDVPTSPHFGVPQQLDRGDFASPQTQWLMVLFSSQTCLACEDARLVLESIDDPLLHLQELDAREDQDLHSRYGIDAVPTVVLADDSGVVRWSYIGVPSPDAVSSMLVDIAIPPPDAADGTAVNIG